MYKRIVVAVGDYPELDTAAAYAIALAALLQPIGRSSMP